jgi:hypothetical protein
MDPDPLPCVRQLVRLKRSNFFFRNPGWRTDDETTSFLNVLTLGLAYPLLPAVVIACNGGGNGGDTDRATTTPKFPPAVFMADKNTSGVDELFAALDDGTDIIKLSSPLIAGGNVIAFAVSPDGLLFAYLAQRTNLVQVALFNTRPGMQDNFALSNLPIAGGSVQAFDWAPGSSRIAQFCLLRAL